MTRKPKTRGYKKRHVAMTVLGFPTAAFYYGLGRAVLPMYTKPSFAKVFRYLMSMREGKLMTPAQYAKKVRTAARLMRLISLGAAGAGTYGLSKILAAKFSKKKIRRKR